VRRDRDSALLEGGMQARRLEMAREASGDEIEYRREVQSIDDESGGGGAKQMNGSTLRDSVGARRLHL
jgi:hypothetical protein